MNLLFAFHLAPGICAVDSTLSHPSPAKRLPAWTVPLQQVGTQTNYGKGTWQWGWSGQSPVTEFTATGMEKGKDDGWLQAWHQRAFQAVLPILYEPQEQEQL